MSDIYKFVSRGYVRGKLDDIKVIGYTSVGDNPEPNTAKPKVEPVRMRDGNED